MMSICIRRALVYFTATILCAYFDIQQCKAEKVLFLNMERPYVEYNDPEYVTNVSMSSRRYNRTDIHHYLTVEFYVLKFPNNCVHSFSFYELLSATNRRPIIELQYNFCDWAENDNFLGELFRKTFLKMPPAERPMPQFKCPIVPGRYVFKNMIIPMVKIPASFQIQDGRIYYIIMCRNKVIGKARIDFQIHSETLH